MQFKKIFALTLTLSLGISKNIFSMGQWAEFLEKRDIKSAKSYAKEKINLYSEALSVRKNFDHAFEELDEDSWTFLWHYINKKIKFWTNRQFLNEKKINDILLSKKEIDTLLSQSETLSYDEWETLMDHFSKDQDSKLKCFIINQQLEELTNRSIFKQKEHANQLKTLQKALNIDEKQKKDKKHYTILQKQIDKRINFNRESFSVNSEYYELNIKPFEKIFFNPDNWKQSCIVIDSDFDTPTSFSFDEAIKIRHGAWMSAALKSFTSPKTIIEEIDNSHLGDIASKLTDNRTFLNFSFNAPGDRSLFYHDINENKYIIFFKNALEQKDTFQKFYYFLKKQFAANNFKNEKTLNSIENFNNIIQNEDWDSLPKNSLSDDIIEFFSKEEIFSFLEETNNSNFSYQNDILDCLKIHSNIAFFSAGNNGLPIEKNKISLNSRALIENNEIENLSLIVGDLRITPQFNQDHIGSFEITSAQPGYAYQDCFVFVPGAFAGYPLNNGAIEFTKLGGTSTATARLTGIASALHRQFFWLNSTIIRWAILVSANRNFDHYNPYYHGQGVVDVEAAQQFCIEFSHAIDSINKKSPPFFHCCTQTMLLKTLRENWEFSTKERPKTWIKPELIDNTINALIS